MLLKFDDQPFRIPSAKYRTLLHKIGGNFRPKSVCRSFSQLPVTHYWPTIALSRGGLVSTYCPHFRRHIHFERGREILLHVPVFVSYMTCTKIIVGQLWYFLFFVTISVFILRGPFLLSQTDTLYLLSMYLALYVDCIM